MIDKSFFALAKLEALSIDLHKSIDEFVKEPAQEYIPQVVQFAGHDVVPGFCETGDGLFYHLLHEDHDHFYGIPFEQGLNWEAEDLQKLPKQMSRMYKVHQRPVYILNGNPFLFGE